MLVTIKNSASKMSFVIFSITILSLVPFGNKVLANPGCNEAWTAGVSECNDYATNAVGAIIAVLCVVYESLVWLACTIFL